MFESLRRAVCTGSIVISFVVISLQFAYAQSFIAPMGNWKIIVDGVHGVLDLRINGEHFLGTLHNQSGKDIVGNIKLGDEPTQKIIGFYNDNLGRIIFIRHVNSSNPERDQLFTGHMIVGSLSNLTNLNHSCSEIGGFENTNTLAGYFEELSGAQALTPNNVRGWYAENSFCELP